HALIEGCQRACALLNGREAAYDRRASCRFRGEARGRPKLPPLTSPGSNLVLDFFTRFEHEIWPPEAFHAKIIGTKTRGAKRLRVLVTSNRRTERDAVRPGALGGPRAIEHRPPHRQVHGVAMVGVAPVIEEPVDRQRIRGAI